MNVRICMAAAAFAAAFAAAAPAAAQLDNRPFQFSRSGNSGVGMSAAGRQAIIEQELFDRTPDNLLRRNGVLVDVVEGPGGEALVRSQSGAFIPQSRATGFRAYGARVGVFNSFFFTGSRSGGTAVPAAYRTAASLTGWTSAVGGASYQPGPDNSTSSVIAAWTQQVVTLNP